MIKVGVIYGGVSPEHEVAVVTALQVMNALKDAGYVVMPIYIAKTGRWYLGSQKFLNPESYRDLRKLTLSAKEVIMSPEKGGKLMIKSLFGYRENSSQPEVIFPVIHGRGGEDGTLQGLLELNGIAFVGCGVTASAIKIDKYVAKKIASSIGIGVMDDLLVTKQDRLSKNQLKKIKYPVMVKPVGLGSSIGLTRVEKEKDLGDALDVAFCYDARVMIEQGLKDFAEVNISIMGNDEYKLSVTEQPVASAEVLSFADKYEGQQKGMAGAKRLIPAKQKEEVVMEIENYAKDFFRTIGGKGIARIDFMVTKTGKIYFNEINTMPGSLAFYLWEASGVKFKDLVKKLVDLAFDERERKNKLINTFESNILSGFASSGLKGGKT